MKRKETMMTKLILLRRAVAGRATTARVVAHHQAAVRCFSVTGGTLSERAAAIEEELQQKHYKAAHASDGSRGDWDKPKSKQEMEALHNLYHKIDALESELSNLKSQVKEQQRIFAIDAPDGESDGHLQEELQEINHIIEDAAAVEEREAIEKKHKLEKETKKFHARDPEHDW